MNYALSNNLRARKIQTEHKSASCRRKAWHRNLPHQLSVNRPGSSTARTELSLRKSLDFAIHARIKASCYNLKQIMLYVNSISIKQNKTPPRFYIVIFPTKLLKKLKKNLLSWERTFIPWDVSQPGENTFQPDWTISSLSVNMRNIQHYFAVIVIILNRHIWYV